MRSRDYGPGASLSASPVWPGLMIESGQVSSENTTSVENGTGMTQTADKHDFNPFDPDAEQPVELVWPSRLLVPDRPPMLAYLDLNHWVGLSKAAVGHSNGTRYVGALETARSARASGKVIFPLSGTHYQEIAKMVDEHRRKNLAAVMEELSGFKTLVSRFVVVQLEIDTILDEVVGPNPAPLGPVELLGHGVGHSVGRVGKLRIMDPEGDATERLRQLIGTEKVDAFLSQATLELERSILCGPQDAETEAKLREAGWQPDAALKVAQTRADAEAAQVVVLDGEPQWRRGRLRDVIAARELMIELMDPFLEGVAARGASISDLFEDRPSSVGSSARCHPPRLPWR